jgi:hypothetical protein
VPEIYGLHFDTQEDLDAALSRLGEALQRIDEAERRARNNQPQEQP